MTWAGLKALLQLYEKEKLLQKVPNKISPSLEISSVLYSKQDTPILFENVAAYDFQVAGNIYGTRHLLGTALGLHNSQTLGDFVENALSHPSLEKGRVSGYDGSEWDFSGEVDLSKLPILKHFEGEAGNYITAGLVATHFPGTQDENLSVHRMLVIGKDKVAARIVPRHLNQIAKETAKRIPVSVILGPPPQVFLASSLQIKYGLSEYKIANKMCNGRLDLVSSELSEIAVPRDSEIILEGFLDYTQQAKEGPFVDLTGTFDEEREQAVITFKRIHCRRNSVYQAVIASSSEHAIFMGLPQELKIRDALSKSIPGVRGVNLTSGGRGYFHCVISIRKENDGDAKTAIMNCFAASHPLKLVVAVDDDVDPFDLEEVEWAVATRFQADSGLFVISGARGSSLDPSSGKLAVTSKLGLDCTLPVKSERGKFSRARVFSNDLTRSIVSSLASKGG